MAHWFRRLLACLTLAPLAGACLTAAPPPHSPAESAARSPHPATHKVEKQAFKIEVQLKGVFEAPHMAEVFFRPEAWADPRGLVVLKAVEQGAHVHKGDPLVCLDLERIDQALRDLEVEHQLADLSIKLAQEELPVLEKTTPLDLAQAERAKRLADEDLKLFLTTDRPLSEESAHHMVKQASNYLEYAQEELRQLEKMYRAKDLREETEEIILKRQRNMVEMAVYYLKTAQHYRDRTLKIDLPRREHTLQQSARRLALDLDRARAVLPLTLNQKRLALVKARSDRDKAADRQRKLEKDRQAMTIRSPADGVVYYGRCVQGRWVTPETLLTRLQRGGTIAPDEVVMTVVKPGELLIRAPVPEKDLEHVTPHASARVMPAPYPERKLPARVAHVSPIPVSAGTFEARLTLEPGKDSPPLVAGMACTVKLVPYQKKDALTVPASAVFADDLDEDSHHVYVHAKGNKPEKRHVTTGKTADGKTEILDGLKEGEEVLLEKPSPKPDEHGKDSAGEKKTK